MKVILIIIGLLGITFGLLSYYQNRHIPKSNRKSLIITLVSIIIIVVGLLIRQ